MKNSILVGSATCVQITGANGGPSSSLDVQFNDIFTSGTQVNNGAATPWPTSTVANNLNEDPQYNGPGTLCPDFAGADFLYNYTNANLETAGDLLQSIGSRGPEPILAGIDTWNLYE